MTDESTTNVEIEEKEDAAPQKDIYPVNSHKSRVREPAKKTTVEKQDERRTEKVISGHAITQKKGIFKRMTESFLGEDSRSIGEYIVQDVLILAAKRMICDAVGWGGAAEMILFGDRNIGKGSRRDGGRGTHTSYGSYYKDTRDGRTDSGRRNISREARSKHDFDEVIFETRGDAEEVLFSLSELIVDYGEATVRDFYDFAGISASFTDEKYGWTDLRGVRVRPLRTGYAIDLPRTKLLD